MKDGNDRDNHGLLIEWLEKTKHLIIYCNSKIRDQGSPRNGMVGG